MYSIDSIGQILSAEHIVLVNKDSVITDLVYDSRKVAHAAGSLFFALKALRDGHQFVKDAYEKGVRSFVVSDPNFSTQDFPEGNFIWVADVWHALQQLAAYVRQQFTKPVIGITGSNGKTVVKEWLTQLLAVDKKVYQSPKSYNSQLGVALSLWNLNDDYDYAIIEAGISMPDEMALLETMIKPDIGVFTNIGLAHAGGFSSKTAKIQEKAKLFTHSRTVIFPGKYGFETYLPKQADTFTFGEEPDNNLHVHVLNEEARNQHSVLVLTHQGVTANLPIPFSDKASQENILICVSTLLSLGYTLAEVAGRIGKLKPLEMRLQLLNGKNNCSIIDDSYSNDLASLQIALDFLQQQQQHDKKTLVLSEMEGMNAKLEDKLFKLLEDFPLCRIILVGSALVKLQAQLKQPVAYFADTEELLENLDKLAFANESILIKGSRKFHLEDLSQLLAAKSHETVLEINLQALTHNLQQYRSLLPEGVKLMTMVKAFSYGSGSFEVANLLQFNKVDYLTVAFADEGVELRQNGIELPIMVLSPDEQVFDSLVRYKLEPEIYNFRILHAFISFLKHKKITDYPIHLKMDTGMHRLGFLPDEVEALLLVLKGDKQVKVKSVFSHLAAAGDPAQDAFTQLQVGRLQHAAQQIEATLGYPFMRHIANTSAIARHPAIYMDMVRLGIGLYGIDMDNKQGLDLEPVSVLKTTITQIKELEVGETVGYDRRGLIKRKSRIATVKIGYADGYNRRFGNGVGEMMIRGQLVRTIGSICMDMCMLDVTDIIAREEDEVLVFPDLQQAARSIETIPYELLVSISSRVKRVYFYG